MATHQTPADKPGKPVSLVVATTLTEPAPQPASNMETTTDKKPKARRISYMTQADERPVKKLSTENVYPNAMEIAPRSPPQLVLFELPLFFHLPLFFLYILTLNQTIVLMQNLLISLVLSLLCIHLLNRAKTAKTSVIVYTILIGLFIGFNIFLIYRVVIWGGAWQIKRFPVFEYIFT